MHWLRWVVLVLAFTEGGWMAFDGGRALIVGDYVTPKSGQYAGQLGPWSGVVSKVGIEPRSTLMKSLFLTFGSAWIVMMVLFALGKTWSWWGMLVFAICGAWYLPFGTLLSVLQVILLMLPQLRAGAP